MVFGINYRTPWPFCPLIRRGQFPPGPAKAVGHRDRQTIPVGKDTMGLPLIGQQKPLRASNERDCRLLTRKGEEGQVTTRLTISPNVEARVKLYNIQEEPSSKIVENRGEIKKKFFGAARGEHL